MCLFTILCVYDDDVVQIFVIFSTAKENKDARSFQKKSKQKTIKKKKHNKTENVFLFTFIFTYIIHMSIFVL